MMLLDGNSMALNANCDHVRQLKRASCLKPKILIRATTNDTTAPGGGHPHRQMALHVEALSRDVPTAVRGMLGYSSSSTLLPRSSISNSFQSTSTFSSLNSL